MRSILWRDDYNEVNSKFLKVLKEPLKDGIKILFLCKISYDPAFGLGLHILDIDPAYTLGDLETEKSQSLDRLKNEGLLDRNKQLKFPVLPQRIAIISVDSSKGYADFKNVICDNPWNYTYFQMLFPSVLQGEKAVSGILNQLANIKKVHHRFDVVAIIRGGGGDVGLSCYNNYALAREIAQFPIPVLTGIGHATNETVSEMVSHTNAITPTKLAEMLLQHFHNFANPVEQFRKKIVNQAQQILLLENTALKNEVRAFKVSTHSEISSQRQTLLQMRNALERNALMKMSENSEFLSRSKHNLKFRLQMHTAAHFARISELRNSVLLHSAQKILNSTTALGHFEKQLTNLDPVNVLKRGYSISYYNGIPLTSASTVKPGMPMKTILFDGEIQSTID